MEQQRMLRTDQFFPLAILGNRAKGLPAVPPAAGFPT
jgi:hypothetical protein